MRVWRQCCASPFHSPAIANLNDPSPTNGPFEADGNASSELDRLRKVSLQVGAQVQEVLSSALDSMTVLEEITFFRE